MSVLISKFQSEPSFLQSDLWANFQAKSHCANKKVGQSYFFRKPLFFGQYYLYGPRVKGDDLSLAASDSQAIFIRFEPNSKTWSGVGNKTISIQPAKTIVLDLDKSEDELLVGMHQKTRYNIRLAQKKGVRIIVDNSRIDDFLVLLAETTNRDNFFAHDGNYYRLMAGFDSNFIRLVLAEYEGKIIAAGLFCFCFKTAIYLHGASSDKFRNVMAPYLLQWEVIKMAKEQGLKYYDFYGIDQIKWPGVTRFKEGFGGEEVNYAGTFDLVLKPFWYFIYNFIRIGKRMIRKII
jgi:lipid II:glycine glycyltransferase (peptidoglycan interpeptide bridge formation enzyme)